MTSDGFSKGILWHLCDAVNIAQDLYNRDEIAYKDIDKIAIELWTEMSAENERIIARQKKQQLSSLYGQSKRG